MFKIKVSLQLSKYREQQGNDICYQFIYFHEIFETYFYALVSLNWQVLNKPGYLNQSACWNLQQDAAHLISNGKCFPKKNKVCLSNIIIIFQIMEFVLITQIISFEKTEIIISYIFDMYHNQISMSFDNTLQQND